MKITFDGERQRLRAMLVDDRITSELHRRVTRLLASVEDGTFVGDHADLLNAYHQLLAYPLEDQP